MGPTHLLGWWGGQEQVVESAEGHVGPGSQQRPLLTLPAGICRPGGVIQLPHVPKATCSATVSVTGISHMPPFSVSDQKMAVLPHTPSRTSLSLTPAEHRPGLVTWLEEECQGSGQVRMKFAEKENVEPSRAASPDGGLEAKLSSE